MEQRSLTDLELNQFRAILLARITELENVLGGRDVIRVEQTADALDEVQQVSERAIVISNLDRETRQLRDVRGTLRRIHEGRFGVCEHCEEDIHLKRLLAIPWTAFCIQCQKKLDRNHEEAGCDSTGSAEFPD